MEFMSKRFLVTFPEAFYSSSDSESEEEVERKIHVEIKPLNNGTAPISASVDELRATVEQMSLSPLGALSVRLSFIQYVCCDIEHPKNWCFVACVIFSGMVIGTQNCIKT